MQLRPSPGKLELITPAGDIAGITLTVVGIDSKVGRDARRRFSALSYAAGTMRSTEELAEKYDELRIRHAAEAVLAWSGDNAQELLGEYSQSQSMKVMSDPENNWIVDEVTRFIEARHNFFRGVKATADEDGGVAAEPALQGQEQSV